MGGRCCYCGMPQSALLRSIYSFFPVGDCNKSLYETFLERWGIVVMERWGYIFDVLFFLAVVLGILYVKRLSDWEELQDMRAAHTRQTRKWIPALGASSNQVGAQTKNRQTRIKPMIGPRIPSAGIPPSDSIRFPKNLFPPLNNPSRNQSAQMSDSAGIKQMMNKNLAFLWQRKPDLFRALNPIQASMEKGSFLFERGDLDDMVYFVCNGSLAVLSINNIGEEIVTANLEAGDEIAQLISILDVVSGNEPLTFSVSVMAMSAAEILVLESSDLQEVLLKDQSVMFYFVEHIMVQVATAVRSFTIGKIDIPANQSGDTDFLRGDNSLTRLSAGSLSRPNNLIRIGKRRIAAKCGIKKTSILDGNIELSVYTHNEIIYKQGLNNFKILFVVSGAVYCFRTNDYSEEIRWFIAYPGDFVGTLSLLSANPLMCSVRSIGETQVIEIGQSFFHRMCCSHPTVMARVAHHTCRQLMPFLKLNDYSLSWINTADDISPDYQQSSLGSTL